MQPHPFAIPLILLSTFAAFHPIAFAKEPSRTLQPVDGVPERYWFVYEGNWPFTDEDEAVARNGLPLARITLESRGDNHLGENSSTILLCRDGTAFFHGDANTERQGDYTGTVDLLDYGRLCLLIERLQFQRLAEDIRPGIGSGSHVTTAVVRVHRLGEKEPIENREFNGRGPIELFAIQSAIEKIAERIDWEKTESNNAQTGSAPIFTNGVLSALNGLSNLRELELSGRWDFDSKKWERVPGSGPKELGGLNQLEVLNLSRVELEDEDLKSFIQWPRLRSLGLRMDLLSDGETLSELQSLPQLASLHIEWPPIEGMALKKLQGLPKLVDFEGYVPLPEPSGDGLFPPRWDNLEKLDLRSTTVTDKFLASVKHLKNLKSLRLCYANLDDTRLHQLSGLKNLTHVDLSHGRIDVQVMKDLIELKQLRDLDLSMNRLAEPEVRVLGDIKQLEGLNLAKTTLTDLGVSHIASLEKLRRLDLFWNEITDSGIKEIGNIKNLESLRLARTHITDKALDQLVPLEKLTELDLTGTDITDDGLKTLRMFPHLVRFSISGPYMTDAGLKELGKLTQLEHLTLSGTRITDDGLKNLKSLVRLEHLEIDATRGTKRGLRELAGLSALRELNLDATRITDAGLSELAQMKGLRTLTLPSTGITDSGLKELAKSESLTRLRLSGSSITPQGIAALQGLKTLKALAIVSASESLPDPTTYGAEDVTN